MLCTNLQSFTWTFPPNAPHNRAEKVLIDYLYVIRRLRVPKLSIKATRGLSALVLTKLMYMDDLKSISIQAETNDFVRVESMAAALRERVTHLEFWGDNVGIRSYTPSKHFLSLADSQSDVFNSILSFAWFDKPHPVESREHRRPRDPVHASTAHRP